MKAGTSNHWAICVSGFLLCVWRQRGLRQGLRSVKAVRWIRNTDVLRAKPMLSFSGIHCSMYKAKTIQNQLVSITKLSRRPSRPFPISEYPCMALNCGERGWLVSAKEDKTGRHRHQLLCMCVCVFTMLAWCILGTYMHRVTGLSWMWERVHKHTRVPQIDLFKACIRSCQNAYSVH